MKALVELVSRISGREEGQTLAEYGLLLAFIAVVVIVAATLLGANISTLFSEIATSLT